MDAREHSQAGIERYLTPGRFVDSGAPNLAAFAEEMAGAAGTPVERAVRLYLAVRDGLRYDPYRIDLSPRGFQASVTLASGRGFCVTKAGVLAAAARAAGIPARLGFADVRNHLNSERLRRAMGTDLFVFHGYTELWLHDRWVKATPAFNASLCEKLGVPPLAFDGLTDSLYQPTDPGGRRYMEYVRDRGTFADIPYEAIMVAWREAYGLGPEGLAAAAPERDFEDEAADLDG